jgi:hypothetical protein
MGISNGKWYCIECGWAAKSRCPRHPSSSLSMGTHWRPGKKGKRTRLWDNRVHGSQVTPPLTVRLGGWPSQYRNGTGPFMTKAMPPPGLVYLGAVDFSRQNGHSWYTDPVLVAIRGKNQKPVRENELKLPSGDLGWPFPVSW